MSSSQLPNTSLPPLTRSTPLSQAPDYILHRTSYSCGHVILSYKHQPTPSRSVKEILSRVDEFCPTCKKRHQPAWYKFAQMFKKTVREFKEKKEGKRDRKSNEKKEEREKRERVEREREEGGWNNYIF